MHNLNSAEALARAFASGALAEGEQKPLSFVEAATLAAKLTPQTDSVFFRRDYFAYLVASLVVRSGARPATEFDIVHAHARLLARNWIR